MNERSRAWGDLLTGGLVFGLLIPLSGLVLILAKGGFRPEGIFALFYGDPETFRQPRSLLGYSKLIIPHFLAFGLLLFYQLHLRFVLASARSGGVSPGEGGFPRRIWVLFGSALGGILAGILAVLAGPGVFWLSLKTLFTTIFFIVWFYDGWSLLKGLRKEL